MLAVFLVSLVLLAAALLAMALGQFFGRPPIRGGCAAQTGVDGGAGCGLCRRPCRARQSVDNTKGDGEGN